jgi:hypothetical protein
MDYLSKDDPLILWNCSVMEKAASSIREYASTLLEALGTSNKADHCSIQPQYSHHGDHYNSSLQPDG